MLRTPGLAAFAIPLSLVFLGAAPWHRASAACTNGGGYPWANGDCLYAEDLNTAIAATNPLLSLTTQAGKFVSGFTSGVPVLATLQVANNTALKALAGAVGTRVARLGFTAAGDGGGAVYDWSGSNCNPAGDNGARVQPSITGCWVADFSGTLPMPEVWGAKGNGVANDAAAINAGLAYFGSLGSGRLYGRPGSKYGIGSTITVKDGTELAGVNWDNSEIILLSGSVTPVIKLEQRSVLRGWFVDATPQTSGIVIQMGNSGNDYRSLIDRVLTNKGCIALDVNGVSHTVRDSDFELMSATAGCGGVRVGHNTGLGTSNGQTVEFRFLDSLIKCDFTLPTRADFGMLLEDSNGSYFINNDIIGCVRNTILKPGAGQNSDQGSFINTVLGDTAQEENLLIDTGAATGTVRNNSFTNVWASGATAPNGTAVRIKNTGGGTIAGNNFTVLRAMANYKNGIEMVTPAAGTITDIAFDYIRICNTQVGANFVIGANLEVTIRNSRIGKQCDGVNFSHTDNLLYGIGIGANVTLFATGNDLSYGGAEAWSPFSGVPVGGSIVRDNKGVDDTAGPTYASGSTVTLLGITEKIHLSGTATVNTITPAWKGQRLCVVSDNGVINFGTSGNIAAAAATSGAWGMVCGMYDGTYAKWFLH